ncbi:MAG: tetratricopeptide repeat protein [Oligoflexus sp.]
MSDLRERLKNIEEKLDLYLSVNRFQAAEKLLKESLAELGELANLHNLLAVTYHRQSKFQEAIESFEKAIELNPRYIEAALNLAVTYCDLGLYEEGERVYRTAQEQVQVGKSQVSSLITGRLANLHNQTALAYEHAGLFQEALKEYEKAIQLYPHMPDILIKIARLEYQQGRPDRAKTYLLEYERRFSPEPAVYNLLGLIALSEGDIVAAKNRWLKSQDLNPEDRLSRSYLRCLDIQKMTPSSL